MIRRGFWLLAGAALGVTGYRKATRLVRTLTGQGVPGGPAATAQQRAVRLAATHALRPGRAQSQLVPQQLALQARKRAPRKPAPVKPAARIAAAATRASATVGFVRDVREGMAEYWDLHRSESDRTLGSQRDHMWSGDSQPAAREH
jgi:hypothetical protein